MNNKYYTPTIEEVHIGFYCEKTYSKNQKSYDAYGEPYDDIYWIESVLDLQDIEFFVNDKDFSVRVKILDEQDILDCGFERQHSTRSEILNSPCEVYVSEEKNLMLAYYLNINKITIATRDFSKSDKLLKTNWDENQINLIVIKNKSELKKLLSQLGNPQKA